MELFYIDRHYMGNKKKKKNWIGLDWLFFNLMEKVKIMLEQVVTWKNNALNLINDGKEESSFSLEKKCNYNLIITWNMMNY